ncbi:hypothetical protein PsorP6_006414 [Peronosclerospora sorghi]|uniref:Uncharacterized protein n=1 Tax=Peronosclerospora sorghi TaxID=230839 RepID=A0ACC0W2G7_9STRA|nr:hypothetical protein PsorP6_006414 [Peronosclerospora sorghi]
MRRSHDVRPLSTQSSVAPRQFSLRTGVRSWKRDLAVHIPLTRRRSILAALLSARTWGEAPLVDSIDLDGWVAALRFCTPSGELVLHVKAKLYPFHAGDEL